MFESAVLLLLPIMLSAANAPHEVVTVPQCRDVQLRAAYLAEVRPGEGTGFLMEVRNDGATAVAVPDPVPLSVHWYALSARRWLWRSSSGSGGALVDADRVNGPVFAVQKDRDDALTRIIAPHSAYRWIALAGVSPALQYRPGCEHCRYQGEDTFRAVLAYAYLPSSATGAASTLLRCGLRSQPVVMPPLPTSQAVHNSGR